MNFAEALEHEAHELARRKLIRAAEQGGPKAQESLPGWLAILDEGHEENMRLARLWTQPSSKLPPLTEANVSGEAVQQLAIDRVALTTQEDI